MKRPRSPRFPFIPLEKAVKHLKTIHEAGCVDDFRPQQAMEKLDFSSMHGRAVKIFAALRAYDLIDKAASATGKDERLFSITENGLKTISLKNETDKLTSFQRAALSPLMFRMLWNRGRDRSADEIHAVLLNRQFTEEGAKRAVRVFTKNREFAKLNELDALPEGLPDRGPKSEERPVGVRGRRSQDSQRPNGLSLPLSTGRAVVPVGITEEEFQLLMQTLRLWKDRLISPAA